MKTDGVQHDPRSIPNGDLVDEVLDPQPLVHGSDAALTEVGVVHHEALLGLPQVMCQSEYQDCSTAL